MNKLPEHKKSPEEIARLREDLGIVPHDRHHANAPQTGPPHPPAAAPLTAAATAPPQSPSPQPAQPQPPRGPKPVRSLKRSERLAPATPRSRPATDHPSHPLPGHRHTPEELAEFRRREAAAALAVGGFEIPRPASNPLLGLAYGLALFGVCSPLLMTGLGKIMASHQVAMALSRGYHLLVAGCVAAIGVAAFIYVKRTQSRHHAALIAALAALALVFSLLHYFPALKYGQ